jgi:hypothetical protein
MNDPSRHPEMSRIMQILNRKPMIFPVDTQLPGILSSAIKPEWQHWQNTRMVYRPEHSPAVLNYYRNNYTGEIVWTLLLS